MPYIWELEVGCDQKLIVMAESLPPLKGGCPNIHKWGMLFRIKFTIQKLTRKGWRHRGVQRDLSMILIGRWSCRVGNGSRPKVCMCALHYARGLFSGFPGVCTGRMRVFGRSGTWWKMHKEGVNNCVSLWRVTSWMFEAMDCWKNAAQYPVDNRNHSGWAIAVSRVQPCNFVQQNDNKCQWFPSWSLEVASLTTAQIRNWCRSEWWNVGWVWMQSFKGSNAS